MELKSLIKKGLLLLPLVLAVIWAFLLIGGTMLPGPKFSPSYGNAVLRMVILFIAVYGIFIGILLHKL